jgi:hypothetical protein
MKNASPSRFTIAVLVLLIVLPVAYVTSYLALSIPEPEQVRGQRFRIPGRAVWVIYYPLTYADHKIRPWFWGTDSPGMVGDEAHRNNRPATHNRTLPGITSPATACG